MDWRVLLLLLILTNYILKPALNKKIVDRPGRTRSLAIMFVSCFVFAAGLFLLRGRPVPPHPIHMIAIVGIGVLNSIACYCHWRALAISQSGTSVLAQADDLVAMTLGYVVLREARYLTPLLVSGISLSLGSAFLLSFLKPSGTKGVVSFRRLIGWVSGYAVIWGGAVFSYRYFSLQGVTMTSYLFCWYGGSVLGALLILRAMGKEEAGKTLTLKQTGSVVLLGAMSWIALLFLYLLSGKVPITVTQPILQASEVVFPALIGLWIFHEQEQFAAWKPRLLFGTAFVGGLLSAYAYR